MSDLKSSWKQTAKSFIIAFSDLGASIAESAKAGTSKAVEWAHKDNPHYEAEGVEVPFEDEQPVEAEETVADAEPTEE